MAAAPAVAAGRSSPSLPRAGFSPPSPTQRRISKVLVVTLRDRRTWRGVVVIVAMVARAASGKSRACVASEIRSGALPARDLMVRRRRERQADPVSRRRRRTREMARSGIGTRILSVERHGKRRRPGGIEVPTGSTADGGPSSAAPSLTHFVCSTRGASGEDEREDQAALRDHRSSPRRTITTEALTLKGALRCFDRLDHDRRHVDAALHRAGCGVLPRPAITGAASGGAAGSARTAQDPQRIDSPARTTRRERRAALITRPLDRCSIRSSRQRAPSLCDRSAPGS
jgi:hypothetical protein